MSPIERNIRDFVIAAFYVPDDSCLTIETPLIETGIVDSTGILEILDFLEVELGVRVTDAEILPENLQSIACIARFVARKTSTAARPPLDPIPNEG